MNIFANLTGSDSLWVLIYLIVAFLIGFLTAWWMRASRIKDLDSQVLSLTGENGSLKKQVAELGEENHKLTEELKALRAERDNLLNIKRNLEVEKGQLHGDLISARNQAKQDAEALAACKEQVSSMNASAGAPEKKKKKPKKDESAPSISKEEAVSAVTSAMGNKIPMATAADKDDLKLIIGVGPFIEEKLNNLGIFTFEQISKFDKDFIDKVTAAIEFFPGRIERDNWVDQASEFFKAKSS